MKSFLRFLRATLSGGVLFLLPLILLVMLFGKAHQIMVKHIYLPNNKVTQTLKVYGRGAIDWIPV
jgi:hypothetical protein